MCKRIINQLCEGRMDALVNSKHTCNLKVQCNITDTFNYKSSHPLNSELLFHLTSWNPLGMWLTDQGTCHSDDYPRPSTLPRMFSRNTCLRNYRGVFSRYGQNHKDNWLEPGRNPSVNRMKLNTQPNVTKTISSFSEVDPQLVLTGRIPPFPKRHLRPTWVSDWKNATY